MKKVMKAVAAIMLMTAVVFTAGCNKPEDEPNNETVVTVTTITPSDITTTTAVCGAEVVVSEGVTLEELGVCWGLQANPTASEAHLSTAQWNEPFTCTLTELNPNTVYHVRAYAKQGSDYYYGADKTFTTEEEPSAETKKFYAYSDDWQSKVDAFNAEPTPNPMLIFECDLPNNALIVTRADGVVDFQNHTIAQLYARNNILGESVTFKNGTVYPYPVDGSDGYYESFQGTVILENMTVINGSHSIIYSDGHAYVFYSGTYARVENDLRNGCPSTAVIYGGNFHALVGSGQYTLYGGKYTFSPNPSWCATGYSVKSNPDSDSETYPYIVSAD